MPHDKTVEHTMQLLKEAVEGFEEINYRQAMVERNEESYSITREFVRTEVERYVDMYQALTVLDQRARLIRDAIDSWLRRGHGYTIHGNIGAHYRQVGVNDDKCIFEHLIPQSKIRDLLIQGRISIEQAMNPPTCLISPANDQLLNKSGLGNKTPSYWYIFKRYAVSFDAEFETFNGQSVDPQTHTLGDHYRMCGII